MILKLFQSRPNHQYPLMRDPQRNPKCYEMTEQERLDAIKRLDDRLKDRKQEQHRGYYGA